MLRREPLVTDEVYHIYNRGSHKADIFKSNADRERFLRLLYVCNGTAPVVSRDIPIGRSYVFERGERLVDIGAYCLMSNHFHLMIRERAENGITVFMKKVATAYSMHFNAKYEHSGTLFQGRFKSRLVDNEAYLNWLFSYIHLNPVKVIDPRWKETGITDEGGAEKYIERYKYSSYHDYFVGSRPEGAILNKESFPDHFNDLNGFTDVVGEWRSAKDGPMYT